VRSWEVIRSFDGSYLKTGYVVLSLSLCDVGCISNCSCQIITCEPEHIKAILATKFDDFEKGPEIRHLFYPLLGTGVFAADGQS
jgi:hypothetical protein